MLLFKKVNDLQNHISKSTNTSNSFGFVPTMGALHEGHLSLVKQSKEETTFTVCSIFVNPTQFNESTDLEKYPRTPGKDLALLSEVGCDIVFIPPVEEVYPPNVELKNDFDFGELEKPMEGMFRPGHFTGVAQVVKRLLDIVQPTKLYMGQKDFQQFAVIQNMLEQMNSSIENVMCPIIREADGLAMSSRNVRLTKENRQDAPQIFQTLKEAKKNMHALFPQEIKKIALEKLNTIPGFKSEYFEIVHGKTLQPIEVLEDVKYAVACVAVWAGNVRLIDNIILKGSAK